MPDPYSQRAKAFFDQYQQLAFEEVHDAWLHYLPEDPGYALDIGAGSGRDAGALAKRGWSVLAVEPAEALRELAERSTAELPLQWLNDRLPELEEVKACGHRFRLILVSAVWMHLPPNQQGEALNTLSELIEPGGIIVITLRHGPGDDERTFYETSRSELETLANDEGLTPMAVDDSPQSDQLGRDAVSWETLVFTTVKTGARHEPA
ncbi:methyltransferase family protein [Halospina denitrificans]|uniref:Methyltransferase family protein n=1 Tax=Halospina denitrificans TaxID=332522 RepID=A0A4V3ER46_9GAMM|nr:class I SAM-dependent methyltransferase [Halospina denitrificans]TDT44548.1 methyltransferase family protein [Halospina denitrificans]